MFFSSRNSFVLNVVFFGRRGGVFVLFILFYFILPFGLILALEAKKNMNKRSDSQLLVEAFNKKNVSTYILIRA